MARLVRRNALYWVCSWWRVRDGSEALELGCGAGVRSVRFGPVVQVTGATSRHVASEMIPMTHSHNSCVRSAITLLTEVRVALNGRADTVLLEKLDEAIRRLTAIESDERVDPGMVTDVLRILGEGLALIPVIAELIQKLNR